MRMPNYSVLLSLYENYPNPVLTSRYHYRLFLNVGFPPYDLVQRLPRHGEGSTEQIGFDRPTFCNDVLVRF